MDIIDKIDEATIAGNYPDTGGIASDDDAPTGNILMGAKYKKRVVNALTGTFRMSVPEEEWTWDEFEHAKGMEVKDNYHNTLDNEGPFKSRMWRHMKKKKGSMDGDLGLGADSAETADDVESAPAYVLAVTSKGQPRDMAKKNLPKEVFNVDKSKMEKRVKESSVIDKIERYEKANKKLNESGIRNMSNLSKEYKEAEIYFHKDLDGVTSAIGMKEYLKRYGIKTTDAHTIQYGGEEYAIPKPKDKKLAVLVDFAHGKPVMHIHTDHHEGQVGVEKGTSTSFVKTPSNAAYISMVLSPSDLFPPKDAKIISTVDSADFASQGITPDDIFRAVFKVNKDLDISKNHRAMGFATNKLTLAYKNKPEFLTKLVLKAKPSLISMYNVVVKLAKEAGYKPPEDVEKGTYDYIAAQKEKKIQGSISDIKKLKSGGHVMIGNTIVQYGGGGMFKGYDRYTPFKNNPEADFMTIVWPMGLIQLSKNPFKPGKNPYHLGDLVMKKVMPKFKSKLSSKMVTLDTIKWMFERDINKEDTKAMGFTFKDLIALFEKDLKGLAPKGKFREMIEDITNKPNKMLSFKQKKILKKVSISVWDIIMSQSGGHRDITNLSGFNFLGKGFTDFMKGVQTEIAKLMKDKKLEE
jgi:hypothetical protein